MALYGVGGCPKFVPVALPALPSPKSLGQELMPPFARGKCSGQSDPIPKDPWGLGQQEGVCLGPVFGTCVWDLPNTSTSLDPQLFLSWKMGNTEAFGPLCFQIWGISRESHGSGLQGPVPGRATQQSNLPG